MRTRMVPFESLVPRLRRILRQTAAELGKKAQLKVEGTQGEMDRTVLERMTAPFEHMLRNSLAHGIELPEVRRAKGKSEEGTVSIRVSREATEVLIQVTDDGAGMNRDAIRRKAVERGLMTQDATLSDRDIFQFVLEAGFGKIVFIDIGIAYLVVLLDQRINMDVTLIAISAAAYRIRQMGQIRA